MHAHSLTISYLLLLLRFILLTLYDHKSTSSLPGVFNMTHRCKWRNARCCTAVLTTATSSAALASRVLTAFATLVRYEHVTPNTQSTATTLCPRSCRCAVLLGEHFLCIIVVLLWPTFMVYVLPIVSYCTPVWHP